MFDSGSVEAVMHFASHCLVGESIVDPRKYFRDNLIGAINLVEEMLDRKVKYLVFSSTCATYGLPVNSTMGEEHPQAPITPRRDEAGEREDAPV